MKEEMKEGTSVLTTAAAKVQDVEFADAKYAERGKALDDLTKEIWMHGWLNLLTMLYIGTVVTAVEVNLLSINIGEIEELMFLKLSFENEIWLAVKVNKAENIKHPGTFFGLVQNYG
jgi:hypothetical protein